MGAKTMSGSQCDKARPKRLLILCTTTGYQTRAFVAAAEKLGVNLVFGTDRCHVLEDPWQDRALPLRFEDPEESARQIVEYAARPRSTASFHWATVPPRQPRERACF